MRKKIISPLIVLCIALAMPVLLTAQGLGGLPDDGGIDVPQSPPDGTAVPFDFGIGIMVAAGIGYAAKKQRDKKLKHTETL